MKAEKDRADDQTTMTISLPKNLRKELQRKANKELLSLSAFVRRLLATDGEISKSQPSTAKGGVR